MYISTAVSQCYFDVGGAQRREHRGDISGSVLDQFKRLWILATSEV